MIELMAAFIQEKLDKEKLRYRKAGEQIGISHTTVKLATDGEAFDFTATKKFAVWLKVPLTTLLNLESKTDILLSNRIASVLYQ